MCDCCALIIDITYRAKHSIRVSASGVLGNREIESIDGGVF